MARRAYARDADHPQRAGGSRATGSATARSTRVARPAEGFLRPARTPTRRVRGPARCRGVGPRRGRGHAGAQVEGPVALAAGAGDGGHHLPVHQPAVHAAILRRLHAAQYGILLPAHRLHAALHVPHLPGQREGAARPDRLVRRAAVPRQHRQRALPDVQRAQGGRARLGVRRRAAARDRRRPRHVGGADGGAAADRRLEPALERAALHRLSAVCRVALAGAAQGQPVHHRAGDRLPRALRREPARHPHPGLRRDGDRLSRVRHGADDDGAGKFFINLAFALCGTFRGGAAKVGIFASGMLGMMSGSVVSNVLTAGTMTIPTMKRTGFAASYAGAIEACASTGAVLAPPVMGATAFVIAQFLNISYGEVALAAIIPAALYYLTLFMQVDAYAARKGLRGLPRHELPSAWATIKEGWYYVLVVVLLIVMLLYFKRESHAPFYATALLLVLNQLFSKGSRWTLRTVIDFLEVNGRTFVELVGILAGCGLLIGAFSMTGVVSSL